MCLRRGQNKYHMGRWFLQGFQQGIKGLHSQHMYLVYDINLITPLCWCKFYCFPQIPNLINTAVRGSINLKYIHRCTCINFLTSLTLIARIWCRSLFAIQGLGQNLGRTGFTSTSRASKQIGMTNTTGLNSIGQSSADMLLPHQLAKASRPPFSI